MKTQSVSAKSVKNKTQSHFLFGKYQDFDGSTGLETRLALMRNGALKACLSVYSIEQISFIKRLAKCILICKQRGVRKGPLNADLGIVPQEASLVLGEPVVRRLI